MRISRPIKAFRLKTLTASIHKMPPAKKKPSLEEIEALYHLPIAEAAQRLGICKTLLKQVCRKLNSKHSNSISHCTSIQVEKWPYKKSKLNKKKITTSQDGQEYEDSSPKETFRFRGSSFFLF